jgi:hypothetical protein
MHSVLRTSSIAAWSIVVVVLPVSGFAQTDGRLRAVLVRSSDTVVRPYVEERNPFHDIAALPSNLIVSEIYRPVVEAMLARSPTFRRQCARIARAPQLTVAIVSDPPTALQKSPAMTHIARYEHGRIRATIRVALSTRTVELIAHELEHVLEQLDGVDLEAKARLPASGVHLCDCGDVTAFETTRAVVTGLRVAHELARDD